MLDTRNDEIGLKLIEPPFFGISLNRDVPEPNVPIIERIINKLGGKIYSYAFAMRFLLIISLNIIIANPANAWLFGPSNFSECLDELKDLPYYADAENARIYLKCKKKFPPKSNAKESIEKSEQMVKEREAVEKYFKDNKDDPRVKQIIREYDEERKAESRAIEKALEKRWQRQ